MRRRQAGQPTRQCLSLAELLKRQLHRALGVLIAVLLIVCLMQSWLAFQSEVSRQQTHILDNKKHLLQTVVQQAITQITVIRTQHAQQGISDQATKREIKGILSAFRFAEGDGYIFVKSYDGIELVNGTQPELIGKNIYERTDPNGFKPVQALIAAAKQPEGGFVRYHWNKPSRSEPAPKIAFAQGVPDWQWAVGAGLYLDDIEQAVATTRQRLGQELIGQLSAILGFGAIVVVASRQVTQRVARFVGREAHQLAAGITAAEQGSTSLSPADFSVQEFRAISGDASQTLASLNQTRASLEHVSGRCPRAIVISQFNSAS